MDNKTPGQVAYEAATTTMPSFWAVGRTIRPWEAQCEAIRAQYEAIAAAVIEHYEASQLMTWDEAMAFATEGGSRRYVLGYWEERKGWFKMAPETGYNCNSGAFLTGSFSDDRHVWSPGELTKFRRLPPAPKGGPA